MTGKPQQRAARERLAARLRMLGVTLDSLVRRDPLADVYQRREFHVSAVARTSGIPESSIRALAKHSFQDIKVPGHYVGWENNRFVVCLDETGKH